jgi:hypothetical protein
MSFEPGRRVKLIRIRGGFWMASAFGGYYLDLNDQPTGTVMEARLGREPASDVISVAIDNAIPSRLLRPFGGTFAPGLLLPAADAEIRLAPICDGRGQAVATETVQDALLAYVERAETWELLKPRDQVLDQLREEFTHVVDRV